MRREDPSKHSLYIELPTVSNLPALPEDMDKLTSALLSIGLRDYSIKDMGVKLQSKFIVANFKHDVFVSSHLSYGNPTVPMEEFLHSIRGRLGCEKFGI